MLIRIADPAAPSAAEITPEPVYRARRRFMQAATLAGLACAGRAGWAGEEPTGRKLAPVEPSPLSTKEPPNSWEDITSYNNFYELGPDKSDPAANAAKLKIKPWSIAVDGAVARPGQHAIEDFIKPHALEERIYRLRCVEAWSMVIPWVGIPLADVIRRFEPAPGAKYVEFTTLMDPENLRWQRGKLLDWPYTEGLRLDEAMHPLAILAVGLYGRELPHQNGAPIRLIVPWKYGFKSIKSIVRMRFTDQQPKTTWALMAPDEYGFYANVNPAVDHPRWSQAKERRIGEFLKRETLPFNGYAKQVAGLYAGMDLSKFF